MEDHMSRSVEILHQVMDLHDITVRQLANGSGCSEKSIYKYLSGLRTCPIEVFAAAHRLTDDPRLVHLLTGPNVELHRVLGPRDPVPPIELLLTQTCEATEQTAAALKYVAKIVQDGKVDQSDENAIENFRKHAAQASRLLAMTDAALTVYELQGIAQ